MTKDKRDVARRAETAAIPTGWEYSPAPESRELVHLQDRYGLFIGGQLVEPLSNERYTTIDPAREEPLAEVAQAGKADVDRAVKAAQSAFEGPWSSWSASKRGRTLQKYSNLVKQNLEERKTPQAKDVPSSACVPSTQPE